MDAYFQSFAQVAEWSSGHQNADSAATAGAALQLGLCQPVLKDFLVSRKPESLAILGTVDEHLSRLGGKSKHVGPDTEVGLVSPPQHGRFYMTPADVVGGWPGHWYLGEADYQGKDQFTVRVKVGQQLVDLTIFTSVVVGDSAAVSWCRKSYGSKVWRLVNNVPATSGSRLAFGTQLGDRSERVGLPPNVTTLRGSRDALQTPGIGAGSVPGRASYMHLHLSEAASVEPAQSRPFHAAISEAAASTPEIVLTADGPSIDRAVISRCQEVDNPVLVPTSALYMLDAIGLVKNYLAKRTQSLSARDIVSATVVTAPLGGSIISGGSGLDAAFTYRPSAGFRGDDKVDIAVTVNNARYLVRFTVRVVEVTDDGECAPRRQAGGALVYVVQDSAGLSFYQANPAAWMEWTSLLNWGTSMHGLGIRFSDVSGARASSKV